MAYSFSVLTQSKWGNKIAYVLSMTCDANSGSIQTPLNVLDAVMVTVTSASTTCPKFKINVNSAATTTNGFLFASSCTNVDAYSIVAIGH